MPRAPKSSPSKAADTSARRLSEPSLSQPASRDDIARRAYELFLESGAQHGRDLDHWLAAEQELTAASSASVLDFKQSA